MWLIPTRNRPDSMRELIAAMKACGDVPEDVAVMIDGDVGPYVGIEWPEGWHIHTSPDQLEVVAAANALLAAHPGRKTYGLMVDHCRPESPGWSKRLEEEAGDWNMAFAAGDDRISQYNGLRKMSGTACFGGELVRALGYMLPDFSIHFWCDDALEELGWELGIVRIPEDAIVRNLLTAKGETPKDANHQRLYRGKPYVAADRDAFAQWQTHEKPKLLAKLSALIPVECRGVTKHPIATQPFYVCCVNAKDYLGRGVEYVNKLRDMIERNLADDFAGEFVCFTDTKGNYHPSIDVSPLPAEGLTGWWNKLALFRDGVFPDGSRVWFFDLDTLIVGDLDQIFGYQGNFATLKDFYYPTRVGPAIMSWKVGDLTKAIWNEWESNGKPTQGHGDLWWLNNLDQGRFAKRCDKLQDLFPDRFVSFKAHCQPHPPKGCSVVCFHGEPRPHEADAQWVKDFWKLGGATMAPVHTFCNVPDSELRANIQAASLLDVPWLGESEAHKKEAVIVGGGPSLHESIGMIRTRQKSGQKVFALNNAAKALAQAGIVPDYQIVMDARPENAEFLRGSLARVLIIASQCSPETWAAAGESESPAVLFHASIPGLRDMLSVEKRETIVVGGGTTVLTRAMAVVHFMGFRYQHLYGVDSSFRGEQHHAYEQALNADKPSEVIVNGKSFQSCPWMRAQVDEFQDVARALADEGAQIIVHGDGLLPYVAQLMAA